MQKCLTCANFKIKPDSLEGVCYRLAEHTPSIERVPIIVNGEFYCNKWVPDQKVYDLVQSVLVPQLDECDEFLELLTGISPYDGSFTLIALVDEIKEESVNYLFEIMDEFVENFLENIDINTDVELIDNKDILDDYLETVEGN